MAKIQQKPVNVFNKGLITEAGELTFPEGSSVDEVNCNLLRDGSRRRRLGLEYESNYTTTASATLADGGVSSVDIWKNAGGDASINFIVVQTAATLHFYTETSGALSGQRKTFTVNLVTYESPTGSAELGKVQITSIEGRLIVASPEINTILVTYDTSGDSISVSELEFRIRDFEWQGDITTYDTAIATGSATNNRIYDTENAGWEGLKGTDALTTWTTGESTYPPLTMPWFAGKNSSGDFSITEWKKIYSGSSLMGNGHYKYDLYSIDRTSNQTGTTDYTETSRFQTCTTFSGRVFFSGMKNANISHVFFSKLVRQDSDIADLLQVNDPTSEYFPDLLDTDGGVISIPEAFNIRHMHVLGSQLLVFAENGVWSIRGVDEVFRATAYSVSKISSSGISYEGSFVAEPGGRPYWWSDSGIYTLVASEENQTIRAENISLNTIQSFYDEIDPDKRQQVVAAYDGFEKRVAWFYPDDNETVSYKLSKILWLDEGLQAFYPWTLSENLSTQYVVQPFFFEGNSIADIELEILAENGDQVIDGSGDQVVVNRSGRQYSSSALKMLVRTNDADKITFAEFTNIEFKDWGSASYDSFVEGGYDFLGDLTTKKSSVYLTTYCKVTEDSIIGTPAAGYTFTRPSSCKVSSYWDYNTSSSQVPQETYRLKELPVPVEAGIFTYPKTVTVSRIRLKGRGRSMRLRWESTSGSDFHLLGYDMITDGKGRL